MNENYILETDIEVSMPNGSTATYDLKCYDGYATGVRTDADADAPATITMDYPILADILADEDAVAEVLTYRGLYDLRAENIHFGDVMMRYGIVINN